MRLKKEKLSLWLPDNFSCQKWGQNPKRFEDHRSHVMFLVNEREKKKQQTNCKRRPHCGSGLSSHLQTACHPTTHRAVPPI